MGAVSGLRAAAAVIDTTIVATLAIVASLCVHVVVIFLPDSVGRAESVGLLMLAGLIVATYFVYAWGYEGATLGQRMLRLRVVRAEPETTNERLGVRRAFLRLAGLVLGVFVADLVVAVLRPDRRALHDLLAGSIVVSGPAGVEATPRIDRPLRPIGKGRKYA